MVTELDEGKRVVYRSLGTIDYEGILLSISKFDKGLCFIKMDSGEIIDALSNRCKIIKVI